MFGPRLEYPPTTLSCSPSTMAAGALFWDQAWPERHLTVEMVALEASQPGWQRPPRTADRPNKAEPPGSVPAAPAVPTGSAAVPRDPVPPVPEENACEAAPQAALLPSLLGNQVGANPGSSQPGKSPFLSRGLLPVSWELHVWHEPHRVSLFKSPLPAGLF